MEILRAITCFFTRIGLEIIYRVDKRELKKVPLKGPLICVANHTGQVEAPIFYSQLYPRHCSALAKIENWDNTFFSLIFNIWEIVPVRRGEADLEAMKKSLAMLEHGYIFGVAPEGTRSKTGGLLRGQPGIVLLALRSGAHILPVAHWGAEKMKGNLHRLRRTDFHIQVGRMFHLDNKGEHASREVRQKMADEIMYQLARLLPPEYRGEYSNLENATEDYLSFDD